MRSGTRIVLVALLAAIAGAVAGGGLTVIANAPNPAGVALLRGGFRNIHGVIHHQTENFAQGMPTDLAFRLAARNAIFRSPLSLPNSETFDLIGYVRPSPGRVPDAD